ncbi:MAG: 2-C-methyl-D-erythritol 4-phosphate cytidylyltransferase [Nitrospiraceae bacterium]|nr:MAG: 2-C-methyl-D-erythritol 4-phosphate cytidylyltransferase [Nitrospiraceae bacterium]
MDIKIIAIVPSAGLGKRFDPSRRKTFVSINGVPLLIYTLRRLHNEGSIAEIIPVIREEDTDRFNEMAKHYHLDRIRRIAPGGAERQDSIYNALRLIDMDGTDHYRNSYVLIHDGVRPYIPEGMVDKLLYEIKDVEGVIPGVPLKDTIKEIDAEGKVVSTLDRDRVRAVQTPQFFSFRVIKKAYDKAYEDGFYGTDDAALVERAGGRVRIIEGSPFNIKVTTPEDLKMVEFLLEKEQHSL